MPLPSSRHSFLLLNLLSLLSLIATKPEAIVKLPLGVVSDLIHSFIHSFIALLCVCVSRRQPATRQPSATSNNYEVLQDLPPKQEVHLGEFS